MVAFLHDFRTVVSQMLTDEGEKMGIVTSRFSRLASGRADSKEYSLPNSDGASGTLPGNLMPEAFKVTYLHIEYFNLVGKNMCYCQVRSHLQNENFKILRL